MTNVDFQLFQWINHLAVSLHGLNPLMRFLAEDAQYLFMLGVVVYWFAPGRDNRRMVASAALAACVALGIGGIISDLFYRSRPFVHHTVHQLIAHPANASFPSDHATAAFALAASFWLFRKAGRGLWLALAAAIAFSRVWVGVHYPVDVLAGALLGAGGAAAVYGLLAKSQRVSALLDRLLAFYEKAERKIGIRRTKLS